MQLRDRVWIPGDPKDRGEQAVRGVRQSLEAMTKSMAKRTLAGVEEAMRDWVSLACLREASAQLQPCRAWLGSGPTTATSKTS